MIGLYYPFIHFHDENWLKLAPIYWSKVARIVPESYQTHDSDDVRRVQGELGAVINAAPSAAGNQITSDFMKFVQRHASQLRKKYDVALSQRWPRVRHTEVYAPDGTDPHFAYIFHEKLGPHLRRILAKERLAVWGEGRGATRDGRWLGVHPKIACIYMTSMAEGIAKHKGYGLLTDDLTEHVVVGERSVERLAELLLQERFETQPLDFTLTEAVAITAIRTVVPQNLSSVSMSKIIAFRKQFPGELDEFQKWIQSEVKRLKEETGGIASPTAMNNYMTELEEQKVKPRLKELKRQLRYAGIECATTSFAIKMAISFLPDVAAAWFNQPALRTAGFAFAALPIAIKSSREAHKLAAGNPMAYLMHAQEGIGPRTLLQRIGTRFRKITTGL